jgi:hypothetical protein
MTTSVAANSGTAGSGTAGTGYAANSGYATNPNYNATASAGAAGGYPTTSQPYGGSYSYPTQPASTTATPGSGVAPSVGYQTGPYQVSGAAPTGGSAGYSAASTYGAADGQSWNSNPAAPTTPPAADAYRTADQRSMYGTQDNSPANYGQPTTTPPGYAEPTGSYSQPTGGYGQPAAQSSSSYATPPSYSGASANSPYGSYQPSPPSAATGPWQGYEPTSSTTNYGESPATDSPAAAPAAGGYSSPAPGGYAPAATASTQPTTQPFTTPYSPNLGGAPAASSPATTASPASYSLPPSLASSQGSYRPGSTSGVQNAGYAQPTGSISGSVSGGTDYR